MVSRLETTAAGDALGRTADDLAAATRHLSHLAASRYEERLPDLGPYDPEHDARDLEAEMAEELADVDSYLGFHRQKHLAPELEDIRRQVLLELGQAWRTLARLRTRRRALEP